MHFNAKRRSDIDARLASADKPRPGAIRNVLIRNVIARDQGSSLIEGHPESPLENITIDGLRLRARFLRPSRSIDDSFVIDKTAPTPVRPVLTIARSPEGAALAWPTSHPAFRLEQAATVAGLAWEAVSNAVEQRGRRNRTVVATNGPGRFFRLRADP